MVTTWADALPAEKAPANIAAAKLSALFMAGPPCERRTGHQPIASFIGSLAVANVGPAHDPVGIPAWLGNASEHEQSAPRHVLRGGRAITIKKSQAEETPMAQWIRFERGD